MQTTAKKLQEYYEEDTSIKLAKQHLLQIDACQIYLKVAYLSDMTTPDSIHILEEVLYYTLQSIMTSKIDCSLQDRPTKVARQLWTSIITRLYELNGTKISVIQRLRE